MTDAVMPPVFAFIGRPNVGKSTLFNRLTKTQDALVADEPGLTRDRQYGTGQFESKHFIVVDTGGIGVEDESVDKLMIRQSIVASKDADSLFFVVDAKLGLHPLDREIAQELRQNKKDVVLLVNKSDGMDDDIALSDFYQLGFDKCFSISATHGRGINSFLSAALAEYDSTDIETEVHAKKQGVCVAVIGRPNVGKSTLINRILGEERVVAYDLPGTTRDSIYIPFKKNDQQYTLIDTAGIRRRSRVKEKVEIFSVIKALQAIQMSHVCVVMFDAQSGIFEQDMHVIRFAVEAGKGLMLVVNKWDGLDEDKKEEVKSDIERRLSFASFAPLYFISAKHGSGVGKLLPVVDKVYQSATAKLATPKLTRILEEAVSQHPPPLVSGRRIKLRYAHAGGQNPPRIVVHGNQTNHLSAQYQRYLINVFRKALGLVGTPIKLELKNSDNPYKGKKNVLTPTQKRKRNRMVKRYKKK